MSDYKKLIYFDRETIQNILQLKYEGSILRQKISKNEFELNNQLGNEIKIGLDVPFFQRIKFLFTNKIDIKYILSINSSTTVTSTDISEFNKIKDDFVKFENEMITDIINSSTVYKALGGYIKFVPEGVEGIDMNVLQEVMNQFDGYDTYKLNEETYVRFNDSAFLSNYKRNDLLLTKLDLYCIEIGDFQKEDFNFISRLNEMEKVIKSDEPKKIYDLLYNDEKLDNEHSKNRHENQSDKVKLFDVVLANISEVR